MFERHTSSFIRISCTLINITNNQLIRNAYCTNMSNDNECPICLENYEEPATLSCLHTFCRKCLFRQIDAATGFTFTCSICGQWHIKNKEIPINQLIQGKWITSNTTFTIEWESEEGRLKLAIEVCFCSQW